MQLFFKYDFGTKNDMYYILQLIDCLLIIIII